MATFLPPEARDDDATVQALYRELEGNVMLHELFQALPGMAALLSPSRQILLANRGFMHLLEGRSLNEIIGLRPGEAMGCIHARGSGGCGSSESCVFCGAVNAFRKSRTEHRPMQEEALLTISSAHGPVSLEMAVEASPFHFQGHELTILSLIDISARKRRQVLERIFFHDIRNTAGILRGLSELLLESPPPVESRDLLAHVVLASKRLLEEIDEQQSLTMAENGELVLRIQPVELRFFLENLAATLGDLDLARNKSLVLELPDNPVLVETDPVLLGRVLTNMVKNALEASRAGTGVVLRLDLPGDSLLRLSVHNDGVLDEAVRIQLFQRSFSTKGFGRGLGTYSMKLLGEQYLGGKLSVESNPAQGTWFHFSLPATRPSA